MLVLALQFSKGTAGAGFVRVARPPGTPWQRSAVRSCRARGFGRVAGSLKTEEKTRSVVPSSKGGKPTTCETETTDPPVHQLGTGSNRDGGCRPTVEQCSLERR